MDKKIEKLVEHAERLFKAHDIMLPLWQKQAQLFYPQRADFTSDKQPSQEFIEGLATSATIMIARELKQLMPSMLRPRGVDWFKWGIEGLKHNEIPIALQRYMQAAERFTLQKCYQQGTNFIRACEQTDGDYLFIGNGVTSCEVNYRTMRLLFRNWHPRDVTWSIDFDGSIAEVHRRGEMTLAALDAEFDGNLSEQAKKKLEKDRTQMVKYCHAVIKPEHYQGKREYSTPYVSVHYEKETGHVLREAGSHTLIYAIVQWERLSHVPFAYSPAVIAGLPDGRLIQEMTSDMLDAGQMAIAPPLAAVEDAIMGELNYVPRGISMIDRDYDQKTGSPIQPIVTDRSALPYGFEFHDRIYSQLRSAFYLDTIQLPPPTPGMTLGEFQLSLPHYIRGASPFFENAEDGYTAPLMELVFKTIDGVGGFENAPPELREMDIQFTFDSPITQAKEEAEAQKTVNGMKVMADLAQFYPRTARLIKEEEAGRGILSGMGTDPDYIKTEQESQQEAKAEQRQQQMMQEMATIQQGANVAEDVGAAMRAMQEGAA